MTKPRFSIHHGPRGFEIHSTSEAAKITNGVAVVGLDRAAVDKIAERLRARGIVVEEREKGERQ